MKTRGAIIIAEAKAEARLKKEKQARAQRSAELSAWLEGLDPKHKQDLLDDFTKTLDKDYLRADYTKHGLGAPLIIYRFSAHINGNSFFKAAD